MNTVITFGLVEDGAVTQAQNCLQDAEAFVLMADNHKGYGMPVGGVAVYKDKISPAGVGFDIACGNKAVKLNLKLSDIHDSLEDIADKIWDRISFGVGQKNDTRVEHELFNSPTWDLPLFKSLKGLKKKAQEQLGTIGSGNHYVDVFLDEEGYIWVGVHFGSRGLGHTLASYFMRKAGDNVNIMDEAPHCLDVNSQDGQDYIACMQLAGEYAYAGRDWVCQEVANILGSEIIDEVHNHHNFAWHEEHNGEMYWIVRKGATPAFPGQRGFVGATMEHYSVILEGVDSDKSKEAFYSTVHGAGRVMSRTEAAGKKKMVKQFECGNYRECKGVLPNSARNGDGSKPKCPDCGGKMHERKSWVVAKEGKVNFDAVKRRLKDQEIVLRGAGADEAPEAYKSLSEVLKAHQGTVKVLHTLRPLIVCMAGIDEYDPYKD